MKRLLGIIYGLLMLFFLSQPSIAAIQRESLWMGFSNQQHFLQNKKWLYLQHAQVRVMNLPHPVRTILNENNIGYSINSTQQVWLGYYLADNDIFHQENIENRLLQQFSWNLVDNSYQRVSSRTRLEEFAYTNRSQNLVELRQLFAHESLTFYDGHINPLVYEEVFFRLNHPRYASDHALSQNRLFLGVNIYQSHHAYWRIGYLNQYLSGNRDGKSELNHVLNITYVFGDIKIGLPYDS